MGHTHMEHGNGKHTPESMDWGEWMLAPRPGAQQQGQGGIPVQRGDPGGGVQRGKSTNNNLQDDANSPMENLRDEILVKANSRKRLNYDAVVSGPKSMQLVIKETGLLVADKNAMALEKKNDPALTGDV